VLRVILLEALRLSGQWSAKFGKLAEFRKVLPNSKSSKEAGHFISRYRLDERFFVNFERRTYDF